MTKRSWNGRDRQTVQVAGRRLYELRREKGLTIQQLADSTGITPIKMSRIENGSSELSQKEALAIARTFEMQPESLNKRLGYSVAPVARRIEKADTEQKAGPYAPDTGITAPDTVSELTVAAIKERIDNEIKNQAYSLPSPGVDYKTLFENPLPPIGPFVDSYNNLRLELQKLADIKELEKAPLELSLVEKSIWLIRDYKEQVEFLARSLKEKENQANAKETLKAMRDLLDSELDRFEK